MLGRCRTVSKKIKSEFRKKEFQCCKSKFRLKKSKAIAAAVVVCATMLPMLMINMQNLNLKKCRVLVRFGVIECSMHDALRSGQG